MGPLLRGYGNFINFLKQVVFAHQEYQIVKFGIDIVNMKLGSVNTQKLINYTFTFELHKNFG